MAEEPSIWIVLRHSEPCAIEGIFQSEEDALGFARQEALKDCTCDNDEICYCDMERDRISTFESSLFVTSSPTITIGKFSRPKNGEKLTWLVKMTPTTERSGGGMVYAVCAESLQVFLKPAVLVLEMDHYSNMRVMFGDQT
jgi:hypothetical protein